MDATPEQRAEANSSTQLDDLAKSKSPDKSMGESPIPAGHKVQDADVKINASAPPHPLPQPGVENN